MAGQTSVDVILYTRENCSLCERAKDSIRASGADVTLTEVDVDGDPLLHDLYTDHVPVIFIGGREAFRHFVHPEEFAAAVALQQVTIGPPRSYDPTDG